MIISEQVIASSKGEVARLRSRAIRPDQGYEVPELSQEQYLSSLQPVVLPPGVAQAAPALPPKAAASIVEQKEIVFCSKKSRYLFFVMIDGWAVESSGCYNFSDVSFSFQLSDCPF